MSDLGLPPLKEMGEEHEAWAQICLRLEAAIHRSYQHHDTDLEPALNQIKYWGETLHQLRLASPQYDDKAYAEAKEIATS